MTEARKLAAILVSDIVGFSRLAGADEDRILARMRTLRSDLIDPTISVNRGRVVKRTGDGSIVEFRSVVDAVRCAIEMQQGLVERNAGLPPERRIEFRVGIHLGDVVEESDGDLMGDGVNIAARLEGIARPGAICLSEDAYRQVKGRLDLTVSDLGQTELKNIAEPIRVYSLEVGPSAHASPSPASPPRRSRRLRRGCQWSCCRSRVWAAGPEHEHFVDGVTESLTTDLSQITNAFVVARNTAFAYKGKPVDATQVGRELKVRYILEGSIQRGGSRLRVNAQLIDATTGAHLWADRFDKSMADPFDTQDEIVSRLANQLRPELMAAEARRAEQEENPDSVDLYFLGLQVFGKGGVENIKRARDLFERAVALDPGNVDALVGAARAGVIVGAIYGDDDRASTLAEAEALLIKGISIAPRNFWAHLWLGFVLIHTNRAQRGIGELEQAAALNRNLGAAHAWIGLAKIVLGRAEEAEAHINEAFRLSPAESFGFMWWHLLGVAKLHLGADEEAVALFRRSIDINRNYPLSQLYGAAALALVGRLDEARAETKSALAIAPHYSLARFRNFAESDNPVFLRQRERIAEGLRKAGVPEE